MARKELAAKFISTWRRYGISRDEQSMIIVIDCSLYLCCLNDIASIVDRAHRSYSSLNHHQLLICDVLIFSMQKMHQSHSKDMNIP
jgi:hypothetical protein